MGMLRVLLTWIFKVAIRLSRQSGSLGRSGASVISHLASKTACQHILSEVLYYGIWSIV